MIERWWLKYNGELSLIDRDKLSQLKRRKTNRPVMVTLTEKRLTFHKGNETIIIPHHVFEKFIKVYLDFRSRI